MKITLMFVFGFIIGNLLTRLLKHKSTTEFNINVGDMVICKLTVGYHEGIVINKTKHHVLVKIFYSDDEVEVSRVRLSKVYPYQKK